jgi:hypothetical protein
MAPHQPLGSSADSSIRIIRRMLGLVLWLSLAGTAIDLLLLDHIESWTQLIPLVVLALAASTLLWSALGGGAPAIRAFQLVMLLLILSGGLGMFLHYRGNVEFQTEIDPAIEGTALFWKVIRAKAPPALAPFAMVQLGLIGLAYAFRHPSQGSRPPMSDAQEQ